MGTRREKRTSVYVGPIATDNKNRDARPNNSILGLERLVILEGDRRAEFAAIVVERVEENLSNFEGNLVIANGSVVLVLVLVVIEVQFSRRATKLWSQATISLRSTAQLFGPLHPGGLVAAIVGRWCHIAGSGSSIRCHCLLRWRLVLEHLRRIVQCRRHFVQS